MPQPLDVVDYDPVWSANFEDVGTRLRAALGDLAIRIDHIGSTAVPGLAAKPVIDIQVSVAALEPVSAYQHQIESCGFVWRADNPERTKRYFRERPSASRTHLHVRRHGSFSEQFALLFRDYVREHPQRAADYAAVKRSLSHLLESARDAYVDAKAPFVWETIHLADDWAQTVGWEPGPSDA